MTKQISKDGKMIRVVFSFCGIESTSRFIPIEQFKTSYIVIQIDGEAYVKEGSPVSDIISTKTFTFQFKGKSTSNYGGLPMMELI